MENEIELTESWKEKKQIENENKNRVTEQEDDCW